jgi:glycerate kinase
VTRPSSARPPRIVLAPDSFKGSLSAPEVCAALASGLRRVWPQAEIALRPMADGGEGTLDAVLGAVGREGTRSVAIVRGAGGDPVEAHYGIIERGSERIGVIEVAQVVGITDPAGVAVPVGRRASQGVGELVARLLDSNVTSLMIGLGGSSTNDGGAGMLVALGVRFLDASGAAVAPTPEGLAHLVAVDASHLDPRLRACAITIMSDVNNPLCGPTGATAIFGPQKGVTAAEIAAFDATLARYAALAEQALRGSVATAPGAGAAGGLGFALQLVSGRFASGAEVVADLIGLDAAIAVADWAITGEGRSDRQTALRKAPFVVAECGAARGVPVTLISGAVDASALPVLGQHFAGCFGLPNGPATLAECIAGTGELLADRAEQLGRLRAALRDAAGARVVE